jgi:hypothetical protein
LALGDALAGTQGRLLYLSLSAETFRTVGDVRRPFPSKENRQILERDDLRPARRTRESGDRFGIAKPSPQGGGTSHGARRLQERLGDWEGLLAV